MATATKTRPRKTDEGTPATTQAAPEAPEAPATTATVPAAGPDLKVVMVAAALDANPDGITGEGLVAASGMQPAVVLSVLDAMELAGAASRLAPAEGSEVERWRRVDSVDLATIDVANVPTECVCQCGNRHRRMVNIHVGAVRNGNGNGGDNGNGVNADGNRKLGKGEAERMVLAYVTGEPEGTTFTYGSIAKALEAKHSRRMSTGTTRNAQEKLRAAGILRAASDDPHETKVMVAPDYRDHLGKLSPEIRQAAVV